MNRLILSANKGTLSSSFMFVNLLFPFFTVRDITSNSILNWMRRIKDSLEKRDWYQPIVSIAFLEFGVLLYFLLLFCQ